jgi:hypothetical protein
MTALPGRGHIAERTCLVCRCKKPKAELTRLGLDLENGRLLVDAGSRMKGRGGYACLECLPNLRLDKRLQRAFRNRVRQLCFFQEL